MAERDEVLEEFLQNYPPREYSQGMEKNLFSRKNLKMMDSIQDGETYHNSGLRWFTGPIMQNPLQNDGDGITVKDALLNLVGEIVFLPIRLPIRLAANALGYAQQMNDPELKFREEKERMTANERTLYNDEFKERLEKDHACEIKLRGEASESDRYEIIPEGLKEGDKGLEVMILHKGERKGESSVSECRFEIRSRDEWERIQAYMQTNRFRGRPQKDRLKDLQYHFEMRKDGDTPGIWGTMCIKDNEEAAIMMFKAARAIAEKRDYVLEETTTKTVRYNVKAKSEAEALEIVQKAAEANKFDVNGDIYNENVSRVPGEDRFTQVVDKASGKTIYSENDKSLTNGPAVVKAPDGTYTVMVKSTQKLTYECDGVNAKKAWENHGKAADIGAPTNVSIRPYDIRSAKVFNIQGMSVPVLKSDEQMQEALREAFIRSRMDTEGNLKIRTNIPFDNFAVDGKATRYVNLDENGRATNEVHEIDVFRTSLKENNDKTYTDNFGVEFNISADELQRSEDAAALSRVEISVTPKYEGDSIIDSDAEWVNDARLEMLSAGMDEDTCSRMLTYLTVMKEDFKNTDIEVEMPRDCESYRNSVSEGHSLLDVEKTAVSRENNFDPAVEDDMETLYIEAEKAREVREAVEDIGDSIEASQEDKKSIQSVEITMKEPEDDLHDAKADVKVKLKDGTEYMAATDVILSEDTKALLEVGDPLGDNIPGTRKFSTMDEFMDFYKDMDARGVVKEQGLGDSFKKTRDDDLKRRPDAKKLSAEERRRKQRERARKKAPAKKAKAAKAKSPIGGLRL